MPAFDKDDSRWLDWMDARSNLERLLSGAWYFEDHGGRRDLGYSYGYKWATRHSGTRLNQIRRFLRARWDGLIEQPVKVARWTDGENIYTEEIRRDCPTLGSRACTVQTPTGTHGIYR
jgi:hypothetical protein